MNSKRRKRDRRDVTEERPEKILPDDPEGRLHEHDRSMTFVGLLAKTKDPLLGLLQNSNTMPPRPDNVSIVTNLIFRSSLF